MIVIRESKQSDVDYLKNNLRPEDVDEIWASHHKKPEEALRYCINDTLFAQTIEVENLPVAIFGLNPENFFGDAAVVWMLATPKLDEIKTFFLKRSRKYIDLMLNMYPYLYNYVDNRNQKSIEWLKFCGAEIGEPQTHGLEQLPFRYFSFKRR